MRVVDYFAGLGGFTLATQLDDAGNPVCDEHSDGIVCRRDLPHADVIRTLPRGR